MQFLVFSVGEYTCAIELLSVLRIEMAAEILPIPINEVSPLKCGMLNVRGKMISVVSLRELLGLPKAEMELNDHFIICQFQEVESALWVNAIEGVQEFNEADIIPAGTFFSHCSQVDKVIKDKNRMIFVWNLGVTSGV